MYSVLLANITFPWAMSLFRRLFWMFSKVVKNCVYLCHMKSLVTLKSILGSSILSPINWQCSSFHGPRWDSGFTYEMRSLHINHNSFISVAWMSKRIRVRKSQFTIAEWVPKCWEIWRNVWRQNLILGDWRLPHWGWL